MKKNIIICLYLFCMLRFVDAQVTTYNVSGLEDYLSEDYTIEVNGEPVPVYAAVTQHHDKKYSIAYFDFSGEVTVKIKSKIPLDKLVVLPDRYGIKPKVENNEAVFIMNTPYDRFRRNETLLSWS